MQVIDSFENLLDRLRCVLLRELALVANPVEQLASCSELGDDVIFVLEFGQLLGCVAACLLLDVP
jgi:hypothetical protein